MGHCNSRAGASNDACAFWPPSSSSTSTPSTSQGMVIETHAHEHMHAPLTHFSTRTIPTCTTNTRIPDAHRRFDVTQWLVSGTECETGTCGAVTVATELRSSGNDQPPSPQYWSISWHQWSICAAAVVRFSGGAGQLIGFLQFVAPEVGVG